MTVSYTPEMLFALLEDASGNWGAVLNGVLDLLDHGLELNFEAGENIDAGDCVALKTTDGKIYKALSTSSALTPAIGMAPDDITSEERGKVRYFGWIDVDTSYDATDDLSWSPGEYAYVDDTAGRLCKAAYSFGNAIGYAKSWTSDERITRFVICPQHPVDALFESTRITKQVTFDEEVDNGESGAAATIDWTAGNKQSVVLTDDCTFSFTDPAGPTNLILRLIQDGTGSRNPSWPSNARWPAATEPAWTTDPYAVDLVAFYFDGNYYNGAATLDLS